MEAKHTRTAMRLRVAVLALVGPALTVVALALAPIASSDTPNPNPRDGITNARAAGMQIDPQAEPLMARAPIGTCANDPTLAKCPPMYAVVFTGSTSYADDGTLIATTATKKGFKPQVAHAAIDQCHVRVTEQSPYKAAGMAQMDAQNVCSTAVTTHELYGVLRKFYNGAWYQMAVKYKGGGLPGTQINVAVRYACTATPLRAWEARADGYSLMRGVLYAGTQSRYNNLACG